jgi:hypothetical protein
MKKIILSGIIMLCCLAAFSQTDTTGNGNNSGDTVHVGNFIIIRNHKEGNTNYDSMPPRRGNYTIINIPRRKEYKPEDSHRHKTISTNYLIFDLGFANYNDKTNYNSPEAQSFLHANGGSPFQKSDLKLITGKSSNVNIWLFQQKLNVAARVLNLKYGLGLEMYNFRYKNDISYNNNPDYIFRDSIDFSKNKLYVGYATIPFMININPTPRSHHGFSLSAGVSAGYKIGSHTKQVSGERGKVKDHGDFNLEPWRFAYVAELGLGPVHLYGSYSIKSMFEDAVKQYPYTIGIRFSNW